MVFEIKNIGTVASPIYTGLTTLVSFGGSEGWNPAAGLIANANGDLFGTTLYQNGANDDGTVFEIKNTGTVTAPIGRRKVSGVADPRTIAFWRQN
jgi:uncharacterized repeat protein (TIGR03803 family)